jgi:serine/threonine-protein kinase
MGIEIKKGQVIAQFTVEELLPEGSGGMATVVHARGRDGSEVALKISHTTTERFYADALLAEVEILRKLSHPGVVKIKPIHTSNGKIRFVERAVELNGHPWFFAMEFLEGGSLKDYLKKVNLLTFGEACSIAYEVAKALNYIHSQGYVHNDVKIDNVLFRRKIEKDSAFVPVLIDFGIAAKISRVQQDAGSLQWMSPERLQEVRKELPPEIKIDATKVDVYSVGVLMYRMLTAKMPFNGITEKGITNAIMYKTPVHITSLNSSIPPRLDDLINRCLAKRPDARPTTEQLIKELEGYKSEQVVTFPKNSFFSKMS